MGSLTIQITGVDDAGNPVGVRSDGARVIIGSADAENRIPRVRNVTPTFCHRLYMLGAMGIGLDADKRIAAAERLQDDFAEAGLEPQLGSHFEQRPVGVHNMTPKQSRHRKKWNAALKAVGPRYQNDLIMAVNFDAHAGSLDFLLAGLDRLAKHYARK